MRCAFLTATILLTVSIAASGPDIPVPQPRYDAAPRFEPARGLSLDDASGTRRAEPRAVATGDFDGDGTADLLCGYVDDSGAFLALHRGNVDAIFPHAPEADERRRAGSFVDQPFLPSVRIRSLPETPDFMKTGDFDADGRRDVVIAARDGETLHFLRGDGRGGFSDAERIELRGAVSTLIGGEIDRPDGLPDLLVAITGPEGPAVLIFASHRGALRGAPERVATPSAVTALALGQVDDHPAIDLVAAADTKLLVIGTPQSFEFSEPIESVAVADFVWELEHRNELAVLTESGKLYTATLGELAAGALPTAATELGQSPPDGRRHLLPVRATGRPADELLILGNEPLATVLAHRPSGEPTIESPAWPETVAKGFVELGVVPIAVEAMRLNVDALSDLVVLGRDSAEPLVVLSSPAAVYTVDSSGDAPDINLNGICQSTQGTCTLRAAIQEANFTAGTDSIVFNLPAGSLTIAPTVPYPTISEAATVDFTTQPGFAGTPIVELDGSSAGSGTTGIILTGGNVTVRGATIGNFTSDGIGMLGNGNNFVEGNFVGVDKTGTTSRPNAVIGVSTSTAGNTIGGTTAAARNIISGNTIYGVWLTALSSQNTVAGNYIGTDVSGTLPVANGIGGVLLTNTDLNAVGTPDPGGHNVISGNPNGVVVNSSGPGMNLVQDNYIGTDASGTTPLPNAGSGVTLTGSFDTVARNVIAYNLVDGITVSGATAVGNTIRSNSLFSNTGLGIELGTPGVQPNDPGDPDVGENDLQNYPVLTGAGTTTTNIGIQGTMNGTPSTEFVLEFFSSPTCDPSGHGEGETALGTTTVTTDGTGNTTFGAAFSAAVPVGYAVTATATNPGQSTSELSACLPAGDCASSPQVFGQTVEALDKNTLGWPVAEDVVFVKGDLALVSSYAIGDQGALAGAASLDITADAPGPGTGLYYLVRPQEFCASWQTTPGAEPGRDAALP